MSSAYSPTRNKNPASTSKNPLKNSNWTLPAVRHFTWKLEFVSNIQWMIIMNDRQNCFVYLLSYTTIVSREKVKKQIFLGQQKCSLNKISNVYHSIRLLATKPFEQRIWSRCYFYKNNFSNVAANYFLMTDVKSFWTILIQMLSQFFI